MLVEVFLDKDVGAEVLRIAFSREGDEATEAFYDTRNDIKGCEIMGIKEIVKAVFIFDIILGKELNALGT